MQEHISRILRSPRLAPFGVGLAVGSLGTAVVAYFVAKRHYEGEVVQYEHPQMSFDLDVEDLNRSTEATIARIQEEVDSDEPVYIFDHDPNQEVTVKGKSFVQRLIDKGMYSVDDAIEEVHIQVEEHTLVSNVFTDDTIDWDYAVELPARSDRAPYILHRDEFFENELDYTQRSLTYYEGDEILCDEEGVPVYNHTNVTGELKFGHGSGDENVFYVRNDRNKAEYEIVRNPGYFSVEVHGYEIENNARAKDNKPTVPRMRPAE